ncbi:MAG: metallophosphoesterase family protein [Phycisphaerales bacterium]
MRTAIISDIHSNLTAFEAVLEDVARQGVDRIICLGDIIGYGPNPVQCVDLVEERCAWSLLGNHDFGVAYEPSNFNKIAEDAAFWTRREIDRHVADHPEETVRRWHFLHRLRVQVREGGILYVHGSPRRQINEYITPNSPYDDPKMMQSIFNLVESVCVVGHTHVPGVFTDDLEFYKPGDLPDETYVVRPGQKAVVNPGSVGQPRDLDPRASYAIMETDDAGAPKSFRFLRVEYDVQETVDRIDGITELDSRLGRRLLDGQ